MAKLRLKIKKVYAVMDNGDYGVIGEITRIELIIEHHEQMLGISRAQNIMLYDENDNELYKDQKIINNDEYNSDEDLKNAIAEHYGVSKDTVEIV